jgi:drug/metabolite transporter (DMT)-like permease
MSWLIPLAGLSVVAAVIAYSTGIAGARRVGATVSSFFGLTEVLFAVLFAWLLLGQSPGVGQAIGGLFVLAGIVLVRLGQPSGAESQGDTPREGEESPVAAQVSGTEPLW